LFFKGTPGCIPTDTPAESRQAAYLTSVETKVLHRNIPNMALWLHTARQLRSKAFRGKTMSSQLDTSASGNTMNKVLGATDLTFMGVGGIIGAGVFVLTGVAARQEAGYELLCVVPEPVATLLGALSALFQHGDAGMLQLRA
jgi:hypothetical protein